MDPYALMLELKENKILYRYLETSSVTTNPEIDWEIVGTTDSGITKIYSTSGSVLRFVMPIALPDLPFGPLQKIINSIMNNIEGLVALEEDNGEFYIEYYFHVPMNDKRALDAALLTFVDEKRKIDEGFKDIVEDIAKTAEAMKANPIMEMLNNMGAQVVSPPPGADPLTGQRKPSGEPDTSSSSLWSTMEDIEKNERPKDELDGEEGEE